MSLRRRTKLAAALRRAGVLCCLAAAAIAWSPAAMACPDGWRCLPGKQCPPIQNCEPIPAPQAPPPPAIAPPPEELPSSPIRQQPPQQPPTQPPPQPQPGSAPGPISEQPTGQPPLGAPGTQPPGSGPSQPPSQSPAPQPDAPPHHDTREADALRERSSQSADEMLDELDVTGTRIFFPKEKDWGTISTQIDDIRLHAEYDTELSSTTGPPTKYGEELDEGPVGIVLKRQDDHWIPRDKDYTFVTAKMYVPDPNRARVWIPSDTVQRRMEVTFIARSNEKGKAMNADRDGEPQDSPDLFFDPARNTGTECSDDPTGQGHFGTCRTTAEHNEYMFAINSEDFGGFSRLDVSCEECVQLTPVIGVFPESFKRYQRWELAVEEPDREKRAVYVPKDTNRNQVSDGYPPDRGEFMHADEDSEAVPMANGVSGDGLSAYEEYRGFFNRHGNHVRTDWKKKTLFIENISQIPTFQFERASGLEVIELEMDQHRDRIVNFNSGHANVVDQHGLVLRMFPSLDDAFAGYCFCDLERPKGATKVTVKPAYRNRDTVAHELGHAVGIEHHGNVAWPKEEEIRAMTAGLGDLLPGRVHSGPSLCGTTLPAKFRVGTKGDQGSGNHQCIMKYGHYHYVYEQDGGDYDCMPLTTRTLFDDSPNGTGPNGFNRTAGDASLGNCMGQMWISSK